jgi:K+-transporting ATPase ATPase A chain
MLIARFLFIIPAPRDCRKPGRKETHSCYQRHFAHARFPVCDSTDWTIVIVGALTYFPALSLGPIAEHFQMLNGKVY